MDAFGDLLHEHNREIRNENAVACWMKWVNFVCHVYSWMCFIYSIRITKGFNPCKHTICCYIWVWVNSLESVSTWKINVFDRISTVHSCNKFIEIRSRTFLVFLAFSAIFSFFRYYKFATYLLVNHLEK